MRDVLQLFAAGHNNNNNCCCTKKTKKKNLTTTCDIAVAKEGMVRRGRGQGNSTEIHYAP